MILIAGELDDIVLPQEVEKIYDNANNPKRIVNAEILKQSIKTISR